MPLSNMQAATRSGSSLTATAGWHRHQARFAGAMYLIVMTAFIAGEVILSTVRDGGGLVESAPAVMRAQTLYRLGLLCIALGGICVIVLSHALYLLVASTHQPLAQLALYLRLGEAIIVGAVITFRFAALRIYQAAAAGSPFEPEEVAVLLSLFERAYGSGVHVWLLYLSPGSVIFFYLLMKSGHIPPLLGRFGIAATALMFIASAGSLLVPAAGARLVLLWGGMLIAEVATGVWLLMSRRPPAANVAGGAE